VYKTSNDELKHPYCLHRAPLGTHERFVAFLIEHYGGAFPTWLSPEQVRILPVGAQFNEYASKLEAALRNDLVRASADLANETLNKRIRNAETSKVPNMLVVGEREQQTESVTLRRYGSRDQETLTFRDFQARLQKAISARSQQL
jgi:threonyl-tRNA synthetase